MVFDLVKAHFCLFNIGAPPADLRRKTIFSSLFGRISSPSTAAISSEFVR
jgi:hypothetical protein